MSKAKYYISIPDKKGKKKVVYSLSKEEGNKLQFTSLDNKITLDYSKRELELNLLVNGFDISEDPANFT